ncbi:aminotransferase class V-fold PLP-dependent enzyme [Brachybacterium halotolerans subsp. kimchii]|uniref:pyridoxal phosphate-dependent decarboxylase family protein n=1 Tax=Brachybacterium halotolerans TaxID=2795215 RepID=UPI001E2FF2D0|nr:aminotransferase class V-fold PLP-dependent enzyme [Brachybacterium halotolerans]UEJ82930.1 aminotransferase class V-fold PLP-dependent enzyme [Brachybacterium halotolerans subsp. kimchii]
MSQLLPQTSAHELPASAGTGALAAESSAATASATTTTASALLTGSSADAYAELLHEVVDTLAERFRTVDAPSIGPDRHALERLVEDVDLDGSGIGDRAALAEADALYARNAVWFHHPSYLAHLNCPVVLPAVAAEAMLAAVNTSVDTFDQSLVATHMEQRLVRWAAGLVGFESGDGVFTSGGTQSNLQALFLARERALRADPRERTDALPRLRVLTTAASHFSVARSAHLLGLAADAVIAVDSDADGRMDPADLRERLAALEAAGEHPMAVAVTAGTTDRGIIDPLPAIAEACEEAGVWLHVDAAYGGGLLVSERRRHLLTGIERADSVTIDFHKTFFQPVSSSAILVRDPTDLRAAAWHADYLNPAAEAASAEAEPNQVDKSLQTTRRFDALKLWTTLRSLGPTRLGEMVDAVCDLALEVRALLLADRDFTVLGTSDLSTVLFRFQPEGVDDRTADGHVALIRRILFQSGRAMVARTTIDGTPWLKLTLLNPEATVTDVAAVLDLVRATGRGLLAGSRLAAEGSER